MKQVDISCADISVETLPNYAKCFVCGHENAQGLSVRFRADGDRVAAECCPGDGTMGFRGLVHGGVVSALLDEAMGWAATRMKRRFCLAADLSVRFVRSLPVGTAIIVSGWLTRDRGRVWEAEGEIKGQDGTLYARARGKYMPMAIEDSREVEGYLSYPAGAKKIVGESSDKPV